MSLITSVGNTKELKTLFQKVSVGAHEASGADGSECSPLLSTHRQNEGCSRRNIGAYLMAPFAPKLVEDSPGSADMGAQSGLATTGADRAENVPTRSGPLRSRVYLIAGATMVILFVMSSFAFALSAQ